VFYYLFNEPHFEPIHYTMFLTHIHSAVGNHQDLGTQTVDKTGFIVEGLEF